MITLLSVAVPGEVICLVGPSRVGKSRLLEYIQGSLIEHAPEGESHTRRFVVVTCANNGPAGSFLTKSFLVATQVAIGHPMLTSATSDLAQDLESFRKLDRSPEWTMKMGLKVMLEHYRTEFLAIDEAAHVEYVMGGDARAKAVLNSWKSFAGTTKHVLILVGSYPLLPLIRLSPHMVGRKFDAHFPRYGTSKDELVAWDCILDQFSTRLNLRLPGSAGLRDWNQPLYEGALGCVGLLNAWLRRALRHSWIRSGVHLEYSDFAATRIAKDDWLAMHDEIRVGEQALAAQGEDLFDPHQRNEHNAALKQSARRRKRAKRYPVGAKTRPE
jgi:hypothetical protein